MSAMESAWYLIVAMTMVAQLVEPMHRYDGDKVLRVIVDSRDQWSRVLAIMGATLPVSSIDVWRWPSGVEEQLSGDIYVPRDYFKDLTTRLTREGVTFSIMIDDLQRQIDAELAANELLQHQRRKRRDVTNSIVGTFATMENITSWLVELNETYSDRVHLLDIGETYEGRKLMVLKLGHATDRRPAIWMDSGIHAREWVAPATSIYIIDQLLRYQDSNPIYRHYLDTLDWYFLVVANPDGYAFSHSETRLWRRNRRPINPTCIGVDLNRNWNFMWGQVNASPLPCNDIYRGPRAASEVETQHMAAFLYDNRDVIQAYVSLHAYTQNWLTRWSYTTSQTPEDNEELMNVSRRAVEAIEAVHGKDYGVGYAGDLLYPYSGGSADWCRGVAGIKFCYLIELRDTGVYGFLLPPEEILPTGQEIWAGVQVVTEAVIDHAHRENLFEALRSTTVETIKTTTGREELTIQASENIAGDTSTAPPDSDGLNDSQASVEQNIPEVDAVVNAASQKLLTSLFVAMFPYFSLYVFPVITAL